MSTTSAQSPNHSTRSPQLTIYDEDSKFSTTSSIKANLDFTLKSPPTMMKRSLSTTPYIQSGDLRVVPMFAIDFSLANLTFEEGTCMHSTNPNKPNDYRDLLQMLTGCYRNVLNLPVFGYGAKTSPHATKASPMFPLSRAIRNPFVTNQAAQLDQIYSDCLSMLELSVPVNLTPIFQHLLKLGEHMKKSIIKKAKQVKEMRNTVDSVYVLYVLSTGIIDDVAKLIKFLNENDWSKLPVQVHVISLAPAHIAAKDQDSLELQSECNRINIERSGWPQFHVHFYDKIK